MLGYNAKPCLILGILGASRDYAPENMTKNITHSKKEGASS